MRGARAVRKTIVDDPRLASLPVIVAWIPMLDEDSRADAQEMTSLFADKPIPQFWDGQHLLGNEVNRSLDVSPPQAAWDVYLFYPPQAAWSERGLPAPAKVLVQAEGVVIGVKGTLPAKGDPSKLPSWAAGRADVVGEQSELDALLTAVAVPFVAR